MWLTIAAKKIERNHFSTKKNLPCQILVLTASACISFLQSFCEIAYTFLRHHLAGLLPLLRNNMQVINVGRRVLIPAILLALAGCGTQARIDDTSRPLMPPGSGLVAATVVFANTVQPASMKFASFSFRFLFAPTDGQQGDWMLNSPEDRFFYSKDPRAKPDDAYPKLLLAVVKPGKYRMTRGEVEQEGDFVVVPKKPKEFEVVAGQVTYIGNISMFYTSHFEGKYSVLTPIAFQTVVKNDFDRDIRELKSLDKRLESVVIKNALQE